MPRYFKNYFNYKSSYITKELFISKLNEVIINGNNGGVKSSSGKLYVESFSSAFNLDRNEKFPHPKLLSDEFYDDKIYSSIFYTNSENNYYHLHIDIISRLYSLKYLSNKEIIFLIKKDSNPLFLEIFDAFKTKFPNISYKLICNNCSYKIKNYMLLSYVSRPYFGYLPKQVSSFIRNIIFNKYGVKTTKTNKRLFISRANSRRRLLNESKLYPFLKKNKFEIVHSEKLSYKEQVNLFSQAEVIISAHGAGLTNILFSDKKTKILEIFPQDYVLPYFYFLAKGLNLNYHYILGSKIDINNDFKINTRFFKEKVLEVIK